MKTTPKKDAVIIAKRGNVRQKNVRQNANIKSRAIVSTDSSSSEEDNNHKTKTKIISPPRNVSEKSTLITPIEVRNDASPRTKSSVRSKVTSSSDDEDDDIEKVSR